MQAVAEVRFRGVCSGGLFASDDFAASARMLFRLSGENMAVTAEGALALGAIQGGEDLVQFYLADQYHGTRDALAHPQQATP